MEKPNVNNFGGWAIVDESLFPNIVDENMYPNYYDDGSTVKKEFIYEDTGGWHFPYKLWQGGQDAPKVCFCIGRACPLYEQCFEKHKIIERQQKTIMDLIKIIADKEKKSKENDNGK